MNRRTEWNGREQQGQLGSIAPSLGLLMSWLLSRLRTCEGKPSLSLVFELCTFRREHRLNQMSFNKRISIEILINANKILI
jgi:hypothetical protein